MARFYYRVFGHEFGPITLESLQKKIASGELRESDWFRAGNGMNWASIAEFSSPLFAHHATRKVIAPAILSWDGGHDDVAAPNDRLVTNSQEPREQIAFRPQQQSSFDEFPDFTDILGADCESPPGSRARWREAELKEAIVADRIYPPKEHPSPSISMENTPLQADHRASVPNANLTTPDTVAVKSHSQWYVRMGQVDRGPMDFKKLMDLAAIGYLLPTDRVREGFHSEWKIARSIPGLFAKGDRSTANNLSMGSDTPTRLSTVKPVEPTPVPLIARSTEASPSLSTKNPATSQTGQSISSSLAVSELQAAPKVTLSRLPQPVKTSQPFVDTKSRIGVTLLAPVSSTASNSASVSEQPASDLSVGRPGRMDIANKHKRRRGHYQEPQLLSGRNVKIVAFLSITGLVLASMLQPNTATIVNLGIPYHELRSYYKTLNNKWAENPTLGLSPGTRKNYVSKINAVILKIKKNYLRREARDHLVAAGQDLIRAINSKASEDVTLFLQHSGENLDLASKELIGKTNTRKPRDEG